MTTSAAAALRLPSELTHRQATACLAQLLQSVGSAAPGSALVVDAAPLRVFDTSALAVLLEFRREALAAGDMARTASLLGRPGDGSAPGQSARKAAAR